MLFSGVAQRIEKMIYRVKGYYENATMNKRLPLQTAWGAFGK